MDYGYCTDRERRKTIQRQKRRKKLIRTYILSVAISFLTGAAVGGYLIYQRMNVPVAVTLPGNFAAAAKSGSGMAEQELGQDSQAAEEPGAGADWKLVLVNRENPMEPGYVPALKEIENHYEMDARAVGALQKMLAEGRRQGLDFWICSAYRSVEKQQEIYEEDLEKYMEKGYSYEAASQETEKQVNPPGTSEHALGLSVDIVARSYQTLDERQANTREALWLAQNCSKYGFILRYPPDKASITGIAYEPWHYRYVGVEAATEIMEQGICLEEYLGAEAS